ncbi:MAG: hypothetical protein R2932_43910 [Caldilineaceae bacterium]
MFFKRKRQSDYTILPTSREQTGSGQLNGRPAFPQTQQELLPNRNATFRAGAEPFSSAGNGSFEPTESNGALSLQVKHSGTMIQFPGTTVDALRYMTTRLMVNDELPKCTAIVSALRGEGVTYCTLAAAALLAYDTDKTICYVDLNWWWPSQQLQLTASEDGGITAYLGKTISLNTGLLATNYPNLSILPAGNIAPQKRPMVARSQELKGLIEQLQEQFDYLLLDIPAILTTSDAIPLRVWPLVAALWCAKVPTPVV